MADSSLVTQDVPTWLRYAQSFALVAIPLVGVWVAWQQMQIARVKLQHDLYDRRYRVYDSVRHLLGAVLANARISDADWSTYLIGTADAAFMFPNEVVQYLKDVRSHAAKLIAYSGALRDAPREGRKAYVEQESDALKGLMAEIDQLEAVFLPYLRLDWRFGWRLGRAKVTTKRKPK